MSMRVPATACVSVFVCLGMSVCVCHANTKGTDISIFSFFFFLVRPDNTSGDLAEVTTTEHKNIKRDVSKVCLCVSCFFLNVLP